MNKNYYKYQKYLYKYAQLLKNQKKLKEVQIYLKY